MNKIIKGICEEMSKQTDKTLRNNYVIFGVTLLLTIIECTRYRSSELKWRPCLPLPLIVRTIYEVSLGGCLDECTMRHYCESLRYWRARKKCEIVNTTSMLGSSHSGLAKRSLVDPRTCIEAQRPDIACTCTGGRFCDDVNCEFKECPILNVQHARVIGNRRHVGSNVKVICTFLVGTQNVPGKATCNDTGEWSNVPTCPNDYLMGFQKVGDWVLSVRQTEMTYGEAKDTCVHEGGNVIKIDSNAKQNIIAEFLATVTAPLLGYWIQGRLKPDRHWTFEDGSPMEFYSWNQGQPDGLGLIQGCIRLDVNVNYAWDDMNCLAGNMALICEYPEP